MVYQRIKEYSWGGTYGGVYCVLKTEQNIGLLGQKYKFDYFHKLYLLQSHANLYNAYTEK